MSRISRVLSPGEPDRLPFRRFGAFSHDVIFLDGLWGNGKAVVAPIVSGMKGVEKTRLDPIFEWVCTLHYRGRMSPDAADALLQTYADLDQYNNLVGREVNLRWNDVSGLRNNPNWPRYVWRMFGPEGDVVVDDNDDENLALSVMSHQILLVSEPLIRALGSRLKIVEVVRHPLYALTHWAAFLERYDAKRTFNLAVDSNGVKVPWYAADWHDEYAGLSVIDRALSSLVRLYTWLFRVIDDLKQQQVSLLVASFEHIVLSPDPFLQSLEAFLGREHHPRLRAILRRQRIPRRRLTHGRGQRQYGWKPGSEPSEREEYAALMSTARRGSERYVEQLAGVIAEYNRRWPSILTEFHS